MKARINCIVLGFLALFFVGAPYILEALGIDFWLDILTEILIWSLFAASINLLFGYTGLLSFGQALFFGFGMYGVAIGIAKFGLARGFAGCSARAETSAQRWSARPGLAR